MLELCWMENYGEITVKIHVWLVNIYRCFKNVMYTYKTRTTKCTSRVNICDFSQLWKKI